jgi:hypothetical protein
VATSEHRAPGRRLRVAVVCSDSDVSATNITDSGAILASAMRADVSANGTFIRARGPGIFSRPSAEIVVDVFTSGIEPRNRHLRIVAMTKQEVPLTGFRRLVAMLACDTMHTSPAAEAASRLLDTAATPRPMGAQRYQQRRPQLRQVEIARIG